MPCSLLPCQPTACPLSLTRWSRRLPGCPANHPEGSSAGPAGSLPGTCSHGVLARGRCCLPSIKCESHPSSILRSARSAEAKWAPHPKLTALLTAQRAQRWEDRDLVGPKAGCRPAGSPDNLGRHRCPRAPGERTGGPDHDEAAPAPRPRAG